MQCKSCNAEVSKHVKKCPKCGAPIVKDQTNIRVLAIIGACVALIGSLLPFVQFKNQVGIAFGFMNGGPALKDPSAYMENSWGKTSENYTDMYTAVRSGKASLSTVENTLGGLMWYIFIALMVATIVLCLLRLEKISIITTVAAAAVAVAFYFMIQDGHILPPALDMYDNSTRKEIALSIGATDQQALDDISKLAQQQQRRAQLNLIWPKLLNYKVKDFSDKGMTEIGLGIYVMAIGFILAIAGVFIDIAKYFKKKMANEDLITNRHSFTARLYIYRWFYLMFAPVFVFIFLFHYVPMAGIRFSFTVYNVGEPSTYVGIYQFVKLFKEKDFWRAFINTFEISIVNLLLSTFVAVVISLMLNEIVTLIFKKSVQTIIYLPHFMSWVVAASIFKLILADSGFINTFLQTLSITTEPIHFLSDKNMWRGTYYFVNLWKNVGWGTILYLATLSGISPDLYEAAQIDGANRWQRCWYITLPSLANTIITVLILNLAKIMNLFESVFVMQNDSVKSVAEVVQTYVYNKTFIGVPEYGLTTAVGLVRSCASVVLVLVCNYASKRVRGRGIV